MYQELPGPATVEGAFVSSASFSWVLPSTPANAPDTRYVVEVSSDDFATVQRSSVTVSSQAVVRPLSPGVSYKARVAVLNRLGVRTEASG